MDSNIIDQPKKNAIYKPIMTNSDIEEILPASGIYNTTTTTTQKTITQEAKSLIVQSEDIPRPKRRILGFSCSGGCCC